MRIIRRISKKQSIYRMSRNFFDRTRSYNLPVDRQLYKYGFKPNSYRTKFSSTYIITGVAFLAGYLYCLHIRIIHDNTSKVMKFLNPMESINQLLYFVWARMVYKIKYNLYMTSLMDYLLLSQDTPTEVEAILRIQQHKNFMKNRNSKMDFINIGEAVQYPFPNIQQELNSRNPQGQKTQMGRGN